MALNFPSTPTTGQLFTTTSGITYRYDGTSWNAINSSYAVSGFQKLDDISASFNGILTTFNLTSGGTAVSPNSAQNLTIVVGGVPQEPVTAYTVSGATITFTTAPTSGLTFYGTVLGDVLNIGVPSNGSVSSEKLNANIAISGNFSVGGNTTLGDNIADTVAISGGLTFSNTGQRITGDFSTGTYTSRLSFQSSTVNGVTGIQALPNGTNQTATFDVYNAQDPTNASFGQLQINSADVRVVSNKRNTGTYLPMAFYTGGSERVRIVGGTGSDVGYVGIGTLTPQALLSIGAGSASASNPTYGGSLLVASQMSSLNQTGGIEFRAVNFASGYGHRISCPDLGGGDTPLVFERRTNNTSWTESFRINSDGRIVLNQGQIKFPDTQVSSNNANTLDDYEEGTWTPELTIGGSGTGITYTLNEARYTKIGRLVQVQGRIILSNKGSLTGSLAITGLPFSSLGGNAAVCTGTLTIVASFTFITRLGPDSFILTVQGATDTNITNSSDIWFSITYSPAS